jgi:hypothetical protein
MRPSLPKYYHRRGQPSERHVSASARKVGSSGLRTSALAAQHGEGALTSTSPVDRSYIAITSASSFCHDRAQVKTRRLISVVQGDMRMLVCC